VAPGLLYLPASTDQELETGEFTMSPAQLDHLFKKALRDLDTADWSVVVDVERRQLDRLLWVPRKFSQESLDMPYRLWANVRGAARFSLSQAS